MIFIGGAPRSGTTLLGQLLTADRDATFVGEIKSTLLESGPASRCDCGALRPDCPVWGVLDGAGRISRHAATSAYKIIHAGRFLGPRPLDAPAAQLVCTLRAVREATPTTHLIDSSKTAVGALAWRAAGEPVHLLHCIRNPAEVARRQNNPHTSPTGRAVAPVKTGLDFAVQTASLLASSARMQSYTVVRFEQLISDPSVVLDRIASVAGTARAVSGRTVSIGHSHVMFGNPRRVQGGPVTVHEDGEA